MGVTPNEHGCAKIKMADGSLKWRTINVSRKELSVADVLPTGQAFRWHKTGDEPEEWSGVIADKYDTIF